MKREIIRVEPLSTYLENWKAPKSAVTRRRLAGHRLAAEVNAEQTAHRLRIRERLFRPPGPTG
jgi:hypothetical protein